MVHANKPKKLKLKKVIKVQDSLFRVYKKPNGLTEEEISISKEKKICLVCKGEVKGFEVFICPECDAFYCTTCIKAICELENACWACDCQIDKNKPKRSTLLKEENSLASNKTKGKESQPPKQEAPLL